MVWLIFLSLATIVGVLQLANLYLRCQTRPKNLVLHYTFDRQLRWIGRFLLSHLASIFAWAWANTVLYRQVSPQVKLELSEISVTSLLLLQSSFYAMGRNNSIASLDLLNGFNGLGRTDVTAVIFQTLVSNWIGPVWWSLASLRMLLAWVEAQQANTHTGNGKLALNGHNNNTHARHAILEHLTFQTIFIASSSLAVMMAWIWKQNDPLVWTILAPKYVNTAVWAVFHHVGINVFVCGGLWAFVMT